MKRKKRRETEEEKQKRKEKIEMEVLSSGIKKQKHGSRTAEEKERKIERLEKEKIEAVRRKLRRKKRKKKIIIGIGIFALIILFVVLVYANLVGTGILLIFAAILLGVYFLIRKKLKRYNDIKKMEDAFPDFISLMSSNLRAGMTIDKALLLSSRKEFAPLDKEIFALGKDIITGKEINMALMDMSKRIGSEEIRKTILLITSGIRSGGNLSVLLEQVATNMRERNFVRKRAASNVLMYVIFIFFAVAIGAPILFGLSSILVGVLTNLLSNLPAEQVTTVNVPFAFSEVSVSVNFITYFAAIFILVTDILSSLVLGLVSKGRERDGFKYIVPLIVTSMTVYFLTRFTLTRYFPAFFG